MRRRDGVKTKIYARMIYLELSTILNEDSEMKEAVERAKRKQRPR
jgi:hypothetical protein